MPDKNALIKALRQEIGGWGAMMPEQVAVPGMFLVQVFNLLTDEGETRLMRHYSRPGVYADLWLHCEKCGGRIDDRYTPKYCPDCGRRVKWDEADDADAPRILTLDELRALPVGSVVWEEYRQDDGECWHLAPTVKSVEGMLTNYYEQQIELTDELLLHDEAGFQVRYWSEKPTEKQRAETVWREADGDE